MLEVMCEIMFAGVMSATLPTTTPCVGAASAPGAMATSTAPAAVRTATRSTAPAAGPAGFGKPADADQLARTRGGSDTVASDTRLSGEVASNTATQVITGANSIASGSFAGAVGLPVVIQNTGANVLIQNATVINLQFK